jgi:hypothetical protein
MARGQKNKYGWRFGVFALFIIFVIGSCSNGKKEAKSDSQNRATVSRSAVEPSRPTETQPTALYSNPARLSEATTSNAAATPTKNKSPVTKSNSSAKASKPGSKQTTRPSQKRSYAAGPCPCSRALNCVGPRGGRYCITSGGNKRYR